MKAINDAGFVEHEYPVKDTLFFKIQGDADLTKQAAGTINAVVKKHRGHNFKFASTDAEAEELWHNRKYALMSTIAANPGYRCWTTDVW
jgi:D-lactate dehydrogenase (cytochrome)